MVIWLENLLNTLKRERQETRLKRQKMISVAIKNILNALWQERMYKMKVKIKIQIVSTVREITNQEKFFQKLLKREYWYFKCADKFLKEQSK